MKAVHFTFVLSLLSLCLLVCQPAKQEKVLYEELTPKEFRVRIAKAPIAYLPLGTIEWHGEHLPLGADGIQSQEFLVMLAREVGGVVLPKLFLGPDRMQMLDGRELYGMDICFKEAGAEHYYPTRQLDGSAYWVNDSLYHSMIDAILKQLSRAGFQIVVGHGHGPSTHHFRTHAGEWEQKYSLKTFVCHGSEYDDEGLGLMVDHAAMNETSLLMALRPELVQMDNLPQDPQIWPEGVGGKDPRVHANRKLGQKAIKLQLERMKGILAGALKGLQ